MRWNDISLRKWSAPGGASRSSEYINHRPCYRKSSLRSRPFGFYPYRTSELRHHLPGGSVARFLFLLSVVPGVATLRRSRYISVFHLLWERENYQPGLVALVFRQLQTRSDFYCTSSAGLHGGGVPLWSSVITSRCRLIFEKRLAVH